MIKRSLHSHDKADHQIGLPQKTSLHHHVKASSSSIVVEQEMPKHHNVSMMTMERENMMLKRKLAERDHEIAILKQLLLYR